LLSRVIGCKDSVISHSIDHAIPHSPLNLSRNFADNQCLFLWKKFRNAFEGLERIVTFVLHIVTKYVLNRLYNKQSLGRKGVGTAFPPVSSEKRHCWYQYLFIYLWHPISYGIRSSAQIQFCFCVSML